MTPSDDTLVVAVQRRGQRYVYLFGDSPEDYAALRRHIGRQMCDPELDLDLHDSAHLLATARDLMHSLPPSHLPPL